MQGGGYGYGGIYDIDIQLSCKGISHNANSGVISIYRRGLSVSSLYIGSHSCECIIFYDLARKPDIFIAVSACWSGCAHLIPHNVICRMNVWYGPVRVLATVLHSFRPDSSLHLETHVTVRSQLSISPMRIALTYCGSVHTGTGR